MESYTYQLMRKIEDRHWWFVARRKIIEATLQRLKLPAKAEILEVGCGTGGNIGMLNRFGTTTCIEQDPAAAEMARERQLAEVFAGELPDGLPQLDHQFDLVALFDVIEHIKEDAASLQVLRSLLKPGGRIVLTVPAFNFLWSQHDDENHHQRRYRRGDIRELAERCDLTLDYISYFNFWLFPPVAAVRLIRKVIPYKESWQDMRQPNERVNSVLQSVFSSEAKLMRWFALPFGISLMAVLSIPDQ